MERASRFGATFAGCVTANRYARQKLVKPGEIVKCDFSPGLFVARRLMKGSRLRLVVYSPNSIFWQKNYNSGGVVADETAKDTRTAHVQIYHDTQHASTIEVPFGAQSHQ